MPTPRNDDDDDDVGIQRVLPPRISAATTRTATTAATNRSDDNDNEGDAAAIRELYLRAFPEGESAEVAELAVALLDIATAFSYVATASTDQAVVGHVAFSPVAISTKRSRTDHGSNKADINNDNNGKSSMKGYILAPLAVHPSYRKRGIGTKLVRRGIEDVRTKAVHDNDATNKTTTVLFVYGDPVYYGRFGFSAEVAKDLGRRTTCSFRAAGRRRRWY